jgi:hypothetical protein
MGRPDPATVSGGANGRACGEERLGCYGQHRFGGRCLLSPRPMIAAFSSWLSSPLAGLRLGTMKQHAWLGAGLAGSVASDGGARKGAARPGLGAGPA